jgi:dTDP-4-dehydrorhamnose 3,5-epimerase-like enzyme
MKLIQLPKIEDPRGNLSFFESNNQIPFEIKRTYWIYDVPGGDTRGGHAFKEQHEFIVALSGSFEVVVNDGNKKQIFLLNRSYNGLYIPNKMWRQMKNFSTNSLALVVSSTDYDASDYIRDFQEFITLNK